MITVRELIAKLQEFPPDTIVVRRRYSDIGYMDISEVSLIQAVEQVPGAAGGDGWLIDLSSPYADLYHVDKSRAKPYVHFEGN